MLFKQTFLAGICVVSCLNLFSQQPHIKATYDSIDRLQISRFQKQDLIAQYIAKYETYFKDQKGMEWFYHTYAIIKSQKSDLNAAIRYAQKAVAIRVLYKDKDSLLKKSLYNLGYFYRRVGDYHNAIATYQELVTLGNETQLNAKAYSRLGLAYTDIGDFRKAQSYYAKSERYFKEHRDTLLLFKNHINQIYTYGIMDRLRFKDRIFFHLRKVDSIQQLLEKAGEKIKNLDSKAINQAKGNVFDEIGEFQKAILYHKKALRFCEDALDSAGVYNNLGITIFKLKKHKEAHNYYKMALKLAGDDLETQAMVYDNLGDYYLKAKQAYITALEYYQKAIMYVIGKPEYADFYELPDWKVVTLSPYKTDLLGYLTDKTDAWIAYYEATQDTNTLNKALQTLELADKLVDDIRFESTEHMSKLFWREKGAEIYNRAVSVCYHLDQPEKAFYFLEKNRALLLLEDLTHENAKENAKLPDRLGTQEYTLKECILLEEKILMDSLDASEQIKDSIKDKIFDHKRNYEKFITDLEAQYPYYYEYKRKLSIVFYDKFLAEQPDDAVTIHYILNQDKDDAYGLLIAKDQLRFFRLDSVTALYRDIALFREQLSKAFVSPEDKKNYQVLAFSLYKKLFPDIDSNFLKGKKLRIIADDVLQHIPFESLMTSSEDQHAYLLNQCEIQYDYSVSFSQLNRNKARNPKKLFMGFAPVQFEEETLADLPESEEEISRIVTFLSGASFLKTQASKSNFIEQMKDYKVLHLATHADIDKDGMPWIAFDDEVIWLDELYATKNQADLVVLSACNTSQGELKTGEGLMSLARAFLNTGAKSVIASLWHVNDKATQEITTAFYKALKKGNSKAKALQYAKQVYLKKHSGSEASPYYWSSLILIGDAEPLYDSDVPITYLIYIGLSVVMLLVLLWGRHYFSQRKNKYLDA